MTAPSNVAPNIHRLMMMSPPISYLLNGDTPPWVASIEL
jgi:hypothetical protein